MEVYCLYTGLWHFTSSPNKVTNLEHVNADKSRDRSWNTVGSNEGHDGDHSKTSVVQFTALLGLQSGCINTGEVNRRENNGRGGSSLHVVSSLRFRSKLSNEDGSQDLGLSGVRNGIPSVEGLHGRQGFKRDVLAEHTGEVVSGSLDNVSSGGKHSNTAVLQFSGTEPCERLVTSPSGKSKGVESLERGGGSGQIGQSPELGAGTLSVGKEKKSVNKLANIRKKRHPKAKKSNNPYLLGSRGKGSGGSGKGEESKDLHVFQNSCYSDENVGRYRGFFSHPARGGMPLTYVVTSGT